MRDAAVTAFRLALAHHPLCQHFHSDRFGPFCSGCAVFMPVLLLALPAAVSAYLRGADPVAMLATGIVLGFPQVLGARRRFGRPVRAAIKLLGAVGLAAAFVGALMLPVPAAAKAVVLAGGVAGAAVLLWWRMRSILARCHACPWRRDWERCPGFVPGAPPEPPGPQRPLEAGAPRGHGLAPSRTP